MEYKLFRRPPRKEDFLKAIQYEINLDKLRKIRKERLGVINGSNDSEFGISNRIHALYGRATKRFKGDVQLWQERISYAKQLNQNSMVSRLYGQALAVHPSCVKLWLMAAKFEFEDRKDVNASRSLFQQGLRVNRSSKKLWIEYYRMELMAVDKLRKRSDVLLLEEKEMSDEVLNFAISSVVYEEAIKAIPNDVEFRLTCLSILDLFDSTEDKQREIYDNVMKDFPNSGLFHDFTAKRCWKKITDSTSVSKIRKLEKKSEDLYVQSIHELSERNVKEELCILWERYIHWNMERLEYWRCRDGSTDDISNRVSCLLKTSLAAASNGVLNEESALKLVRELQ
jgi:U3 small nucleolar RNA-associated protein 6